MCKQGGKLKVYGAGLLSSVGELKVRYPFKTFYSLKKIILISFIVKLAESCMFLKCPGAHLFIFSHPSMRPFVRPSILSSVRSSAHSFVRSFIHLVI